MEPGALRRALLIIGVLAGTLFVVVTVAVPVILLLNTDDRTLSRWSNVGQALSPIGVLFSGLAFIGIAVTLALLQPDPEPAESCFETGTIELDELRGALTYFMTSPDVYEFWAKARAPRITVTEGDQGEDSFTREVDRAFINARRPNRPDPSRPSG